MTEPKTYHGNTPSYDVLQVGGLQKIIDAILQLMQEIGIRFDSHERAIDLLSGAGCNISSEGIVTFPTDLVRSSLDSAGKSVRIWNRPGTEYIEFGGEHSSFFAGAGADNVIDLETGERRPSTREDLATATRVADALPKIDGVCLPCKMTEKSNVFGEIEEFSVMVANTTKPVAYLCENKAALEAAIEMAAAIRGGVDRLREKPYFSFGISALPLYYPNHSIDQIFLAVENGIPLSVGTMTIGGASAPITHAGNLVNLIATGLAGVVLTQLIEKGCFCMVEAEPGFMDPSTGGLGGFAETYLAEAANSQISRYLGLPLKTVTAGVCLSEQFDQQAIMEVSLSLSHTIFRRAAQHYGVGLIDGGRIYSLHSLLFCNELVSFIRHNLKGIAVDDEALALDVTKAVGHSVGFISEMHTATHCRSDMLNNKYFRPPANQQSEQGSKKSVTEMIDEELQQILGTHKPEPLPDSIREQIDEIIKRFGAG
jgi:trimethylamine--corrinoid protein Co-methyltransferase